MADLYYVLLIFCCLIMESLFSGAELALISSNINKIRIQAKKGIKSANYALKLLDKPEWFLATTLIGTNLAIVAGASTATALFISLFGPGKGEIVSAIVMIPLLIFMIVIRSIFQQHAEFTAVRLARFISVASFIFLPLVFLISHISRRAVNVIVREKAAISPFITKDGLKFILEDKGGNSDILSTEKEMVKAILDFSGVTVDKIMIPLSAVMSLPVTATLGEAISLIKEKKYLSIPVYREQVFNITGILDYFDLLEAMRGGSAGRPFLSQDDTLASFLNRDVLYVPETKPAKDLLIELQMRDERMAVIVDEYGGAVGIVTIEDILEEIVGEIDDGYERGDKLYKRIGAGKYLINARISVERISQLFPLDIPEGDYETLGGFLLYKMGRIPKRKDSMRQGDAIFVIEDADMKTINEVLVEFPAARDGLVQKEH